MVFHPTTKVGNSIWQRRELSSSSLVHQKERGEKKKKMDGNGAERTSLPMKACYRLLINSSNFLEMASF